jgi:glycosyltransferase involved in cell wall biosynthesis
VRVALLHEWFGTTGGSERVFLAMSSALPRAEKYVLWNECADLADLPELRQSWLARTPLRNHKAIALPLMPIAWRTLSRRPYDVVVSSSHAFAHTAKLGRSPHTRYLSYVHAPARYVWSPHLDRRGSSPALVPLRALMKRVDVGLSRHVDSYAANSVEVRDRIREYWKRDAVVIHPPVDVDFFAAPVEAPADRTYLLGVGRWIPYKRFDLIIDIAAAARRPLVIAGSGPLEAQLRRRAAESGVAVTFEHQPTPERLRELYRGALALVFPVHEDFGMIPVEAQAAGTPVLGLARGGLLETVVDGKTGFLLDSLEPADYAEAVRRLGQLQPEDTTAHAMQFSTARFHREFAGWVASTAGEDVRDVS